jgi:hypothetical protein
VRLIGQLGDQREVIATEAVRVVVLVIIAHIGPGESDRVEFLFAFILSHGGSNAAKAEGLYRQVRGRSGVLILSRRLSVLLGIRVPFFVRSRDCSLTQKAEAPLGDEGTLWGIPFKEDPNASRPQKRRTTEGGTARESKNEIKKKNGPLAAECQKKTRNPPRQHGTHLPASVEESVPVTLWMTGE